MSKVTFKIDLGVGFDEDEKIIDEFKSNLKG